MLDCSENIPKALHLGFLAESELTQLENERRQMLDIQMPSFIRGDEDEDAREIF